MDVDRKNQHVGRVATRRSSWRKLGRARWGESETRPYKLWIKEKVAKPPR